MEWDLKEGLSYWIIIRLGVGEGLAPPNPPFLKAAFFIGIAFVQIVRFSGGARPSPTVDLANFRSCIKFPLLRALIFGDVVGAIPYQGYYDTLKYTITFLLYNSRLEKQLKLLK